MRLDWRQPDPMEIETLDPRWILNLYRLLQEAIANAVQHSGADRLLIAIDNPRGRRLTIRVEDNGEGFEPGTSGGRCTRRSAMDGFSRATRAGWRAAARR